MAVVARPRKRGITYYVTFYFDGRKVWERAGTDEREARRLSRRRLREVAEGTYHPARKSERPSVRAYAEDWLERRTCRWKDDEATYFRTYVLSREWLAGLLVEDLETRHVKQLVEELKTAWSERFQRTIAPRTVTSIYGIFRTMCRDARIDGILKTDPCVLPPGTFQRRARSKREPYSLEAIAKLLQCPDVHPTARVFSALALLTGMREGEVCGRRWRDWDPSSAPLGCLTVETQYDGQPLKGDRHQAGEVARKVPVHPELARLLHWWQREGFALAHRRAPRADDFIVPTKTGEPFGRSAAYGMFQRALAKAGVTNLTLHSTRHTFLTLCRRGGARKEVIEKVTHNASGDTVDHYTHWDWAPLCEAVLCLQLTSESSRGLPLRGLVSVATGPIEAPLLPGGGSEEPGASSGLSGDATGDVVSHASRSTVAPPGLEPGCSRETTSAYLELPSDEEAPESSGKPGEDGCAGPKGAARHQSPKARAALPRALRPQPRAVRDERGISSAAVRAFRALSWLQFHA
jgi:integrase